MAYTTINKSTDYFEAKTWSGNNTDPTTISGLNFQPDMIWGKARSGSYGTQDHCINDAVRGANKVLRVNQTNAEETDTNNIKSFTSDGWTMGNDGKINQASTEYVGWSWKANGAGSTNTDGNNPNTVTVSANTTAGFSIIKYQGTDTGGQTIGHGLGVKPKVFITKNLSEADNWCVWFDTTGNGTADKRVILNSANGDYGNYMPTFGTSTITLPSTSDNAWNGNGDNLIGYAFAEKTGYSKFGMYKGNGNTNGVFVYTGFKPALIILKHSNSTGNNWRIIDNKRDPDNVTQKELYPSTNDAEGSADRMDLLSNGFKLRSSGSPVNDGEYVYMAFAEAPLVGSNNVPCTAR